jgi:hypothetical protein
MNRGIIQAPVKFRRPTLRWFAILLLIAATLSLQAIPLSSHHSAEDVSHCCAFCHLAHMAWANPAQALGVLAPVAAEWHVTIHKCFGYREILVALGHSRAPPA